MTAAVAALEVAGITKYEEVEAVSQNTADNEDNPCILYAFEARTFLGWGCSLCCCCHKVFNFLVIK
jgi:hypothetical protein